ncbi:FAD-binding oxidoreductase [Rhizobium tubonense]|uniref:D-lactate dehydrogenase (cytochrome) n=1 Tax=Rhizobium tubonense TaxID=484088 RepID=A0A2W4EP16_9HYPH|nr:FAD-linked oxidase C-terminal domain-containing protein [Rhizobium tubonense]PZM12963.1 FAD-binding oxidoreductase [Rhizobium tubonense]
MKSGIRPTSEQLSRLEAQLGQLLGARFTRSMAERDLHAQDESWHKCAPPDAVCYPASTDEVSQVVRVCIENRIPIIPFGAGTSLEGHISAVYGGISIDLSRMNRILEVRAQDLDASIEAGVTRQQLNSHIRDTGLFFPVDPGGESTLGGMAATRASGTNAVRYGTMRENVLSLKVVLPNGKILTTSTRARKSAAGYDLTRLMIGSEGTLGIITELTVRLHGIPGAIASAVCSFPNLRSAVSTAAETIQAGVSIARIELLDDQSMKAVNRYSKLNYPEKSTLFLEFHGTTAGVLEQADIVRELAEANGGTQWQWANDPEQRNRLWKARHDMHYAALSMRPGSKVWGTDACVPLSALTDIVTEMREEASAASFFTTCVGHVGDGNFHLGFLIDPSSKSEIEEAERLNSRLIERTLALGGTSTGEHGIGLGKIKWMEKEHGDVAIELMRQIKTAIDPLGLFNPGKLLPNT